MYKTFLFVRLFETDATVKLSTNLDDFKDFCHYSRPDYWAEQKEVIEDCLDKSGKYVFEGNDVHYYILTHDTWEEFEDDDGEKYEAPAVELIVK